MRKITLFVCMLFVLSCAACDDKDDKKNDYKGLSELVAQRHRARQAMSGKKVDGPDKDFGLQKSKTGAEPIKKEGVSTKTLYKKEVEIIDPASGISLAKGMAYLDKNGDIVRIKIKKN